MEVVEEGFSVEDVAFDVLDVVNGIVLGCEQAAVVYLNQTILESLALSCK